MKAFRRPLRLLLCIVVLGAGWPILAPQDINRDRNVDLIDALLTVRNFTRSAEAPENFQYLAKNAISTLQATAGLIPVLRTDTDASTVASAFGFNAVLTATAFLSPPSATGEPVWMAVYRFASCSLDPETPPPRMG